MPAHAPVLDYIDELSAALRDDATEQQAEGWWTLYLRIASEVEGHKRATKHELDILRRLNTAVTNAIASIRDKWPHANLSGAQVALAALKHSIERHTTGVDGWPMRP